MTPNVWADHPWPLIETPSKTKNVVGPTSFKPSYIQQHLINYFDEQDEHSAVYIANEMAFAHNAMIRGINSIYNEAPHVHKVKDIAHFLFFVRSSADWVGHHHQWEETLMFPGFEKVMGEAGFLQSNLDQHHAFEPGLKKLGSFAIQARVADYKPDVLQGIINDFANGLQGHLHDEIPTLLAM